MSSAHPEPRRERAIGRVAVFYRSRTHRSRSLGLRVVALMAMCFAETVGALETNYTLGYAIEHSDNINLSPENREKEWISVPAVGVALREDTGALESRLSARAQYRDYLRDTFADETRFDLNGAAVWRPLPEKFTWTAEDFFTQTTINPLEPETPQNRQNTNVFTTGPDVFFHFGAVDTLQLGARYSDNRFETSELNNTRSSASARWLHRTSATTTLSLNYEAQAVNFQDEISSQNFDRNDAFVGYNTRLARNVVLINLGKSVIHRENAEDVDGGLARVSWTRELTSTSTFSLAASSELSDIAQDILAARDRVVEGEVVREFPSADVFVTRSGSATYTRRRTYGADSVSVFGIKKEYEREVQNDEKSRGVDLRFGYDFSEHVSGNLGARYAKTDFPGVDREDTRKSVSLGVSYRVSRPIVAGFQIGKTVQDSTDPGQEYEEVRAIASIVYSSNPGFGR